MGKSVTHDSFGVPDLVTIPPAGLIICEEDEFMEEDKLCPSLSDSFKIEDEVIVKCSTETCVFSCPKNLVISTETDQVYCVNHEWFPVIDEKIKCVEEKDLDNEDEDDDHKDDHDHSVCDDITKTVSIDHEVHFECTVDHCLFRCKEVTEQVSVQQIVCFNSQWDIDETTRKHGVFCGDTDKDTDKDDDKDTDKDDDNDDEDDNYKEDKKKN